MLKNVIKLLFCTTMSLSFAGKGTASTDEYVDYKHMTRAEAKHKMAELTEEERQQRGVSALPIGQKTIFLRHSTEPLLRSAKEWEVFSDFIPPNVPNWVWSTVITAMIRNSCRLDVKQYFLETAAGFSFVSKNSLRSSMCILSRLPNASDDRTLHPMIVKIENTINRIFSCKRPSFELANSLWLQLQTPEILSRLERNPDAQQKAMSQDEYVNYEKRALSREETAKLAKDLSIYLGWQ